MLYPAVLTPKITSLKQKLFVKFHDQLHVSTILSDPQFFFSKFVISPFILLLNLYVSHSKLLTNVARSVCD